MREFFRGWKRKLGVVSLVVACALAAAWVQTFSACDILILKWFSVASLDSAMGIIFETKRAAQWHTVIWQHTDRTDIDSVLASDAEWQWQMLGFGYVTSPTIKSTTILFIPYRFIVIPLAVVSAYLLLSKPRRKPSAPKPDIQS